MSGFSPERRQWLRAIAGLAPAAALSACAGCAPAEPKSDPSTLLRVPLASLPMGERVLVHMGPRPVELIRGPESVVARSLWCTHMGCEVRWRPDDRTYRCRCHDGAYDEDGEPIAGPPPRPLRRLPTRLEGGDVVVESRVAAS